MHYDIGFPHVGIRLPYVVKQFHLFGFSIAIYGLIIGAAILTGYVFAVREARRIGANPDRITDAGIIGTIFGIIGARLYYVIFSWDMYASNPIDILNLRGGGLAIYGGVIGAALSVLVYCRLKRLSPLLLFDVLCIPLVMGQMMGRWGNFFNREAFGEYTDTLFAMRLPLDAVRLSDVTEKMRAHMEVVDGVRYIQVHPTFLYESLWCLGVVFVLLLYRKKKKFQGELFLIYIAGYALGRVWIEGLRTDQLVLWTGGPAVSQLLAGTLAVIGISALIICRKKLCISK